MTEPPSTIGTNRVVGLSGSALDRLMPMHIWVGAGNIVVRAGPTITRLAGRELRGRHLEDVLTLRRPRETHSLDQLLRLQGLQLRLTLNDIPDLPLKGHVVALPGGTGAFLDLSLGISLFETVKRFDLTLSDFAPTDLAVELLYLIEAKSAVTGELKRLAQQINGARVSAETDAVTDVLTELFNRRGLQSALGQIVAEKRPFALMHLDLDHFKRINDNYGHAAGDAVLRHVGRVLRTQCRGDDLCARVGGDEFVVLFADLVDPDRLFSIAERLIAKLEDPVELDGEMRRISASIGVTVSDAVRSADPDALMREADIALYASKGKGRGCATVYRADDLDTGPDSCRRA